jgi:exosortase/archaeosortase family protein
MFDIKALVLLISSLLILSAPFFFLIYEQASQNQLSSQGFSLLAIPTCLALLSYSLFRYQGDFSLINAFDAKLNQVKDHALGTQQASASFIDRMRQRQSQLYLLIFLLCCDCFCLLWMQWDMKLGLGQTWMSEQQLFFWIFTLFSILLPSYYLLIHLVYQIEDHVIDYPLLLLFLALPLEPMLRSHDLMLQRIGAEWAVSLLNFIALFPLDTDYHLSFINAYTFRSDRFYLIINESCSGVNLLLSNLIFVIALGYFFKLTRWRWLILVFASIPLSMFFNACRIAAIFWMGHFHGVELAMGPWHDRMAYLSSFGLALSVLLLESLIHWQYQLRHKR